MLFKLGLPAPPPPPFIGPQMPAGGLPARPPYVLPGGGAMFGPPAPPARPRRRLVPRRVRNRQIRRRGARIRPVRAARGRVVRRPVVRRPAPGINPAVINFYHQQSFEPQYVEDDMSKRYPYLFGPKGLYSGIVCRYPCRMINGACVCPE